MDEDLKLLILEPEGPQRDPRLGAKVYRTEALNAIASAGAKVRHDSGGRLIVIEASRTAEEALATRLPGARIVPLAAAARESIAGLDPTESLFLEALKIRTSTDYREAKKRRKVGDTPEEQDLVSGPDVREEY